MDPSLNQPRILFIGGTGRSGTNITKDILARHSQVASLPFEYRFLLDPDGIVDFYSSYSASWSPTYADKRLKRLEQFLLALARQSRFQQALGIMVGLWGRLTRTRISPQQYPGWELAEHFPRYVEQVHRLMIALREFSYDAVWHGTPSFQWNPKLDFAGPKGRVELAKPLGNFINALVGEYLAINKKQLFIEDNTWNILHAEQLFEICPQARMLHVYRDPRDVVVSLMKQRWAPSELDQAVRYYLAIMDAWLVLRDKLPAERVLEVRLEDIVKDSPKTLDRICTFAGLSFEEALLEVDLTKSNQGRWQHDLDRKDQAHLEELLQDMVVRLGYT